MQTIQTDLGRFDRYVRFFVAIMFQLNRKLLFITLAYSVLLLLISFDAWLEHLGASAGLFLHIFLNVPLYALLFCLSFFSLLNSGLNARRANHAALIFTLALLAIDSNVIKLGREGGEVLCNLLSGGPGVFVGYAIVQYYLVTTAIGKGE